MRTFSLKYLAAGVAGLAIALIPSVCKADAMVTYYHSATYQNGAIVTGTVLFDRTTGIFGAANLTATISGVSIFFTGLPVDQEPYFQGNLTQYQAQYLNVLNKTLVGIDIPAPGGVDIGYNGGLECSLASLCNGTSGYIAFSPSGTFGADSSISVQTSGSLSPVPEPSSIVLMGTGIGLLAAFSTKRLIHANPNPPSTP